MAHGTDPQRVHNPSGGTLEGDVARIVREAVAQALAEAQLERPAPLPVAVSYEEAGQLIGVHAATIRSMVSEGRLRTIDMGDRSSKRIPVAALFELDPEYRGAVAELDRLRDRVASLEEAVGGRS